MKMSEGGGLATRGHRTAVVCDASAFNLRFLRAAARNLGFEDVIEAHSVEELVHRAVLQEAHLVIFDPAMEAGGGIGAIATLQAELPDVVLIAFCSDETVCATLRSMDVTTVERVSIVNLDSLVAAVESVLGPVAPTGVDETIPVTDMVTPVWEAVPTLAGI